MSQFKLKLQPLTREAFEPFGNVIETENAKHFGINAGTIERFHDLAHIDVGIERGGIPLFSIAQCNKTTRLPYQINFVERHPLGSQAFYPLFSGPMISVVAPPGELVNQESLRAFFSNGNQGVNIQAGVWHMPLISLEVDQKFIIVDRGGPGNNCDEYHFDSDNEVLLQDFS